MVFSYDLKLWAGDGQDWCTPVRLGACGDLVPEADVSQIVCTARNLNTNTIIGSRNAQDVFNANDGTYADGQFTFALQPSDTAIAGSALTTDRETHAFQFTFTLTDGTVGTLSLMVECLARPATALNEAADLGYLRQRFRIMINQTNSLVPDDDWIDLTLQDGITATNARLKYSYEDLEVTLVAGTAEYDLPSNYINSLWHSWSGEEQYEADQDQLRRRNYWWRTQPEGTPEKYAIWKQKLIVIPTPNAAAVAKDDTYLIRAYTTPPAFRLSGMSQLSREHWEIPMFFAASQWYGGPGGNRPATAKFYWELWDQRSKEAMGAYEKRKVV